MGPAGVAFVRIFVGFLTLSCYPGSWRKIDRRDRGRVALLGAIWFAFPLSMFPLAEQRVSSALTGMLNGSNPLFATLVASALARRLPSRGVATGLGIGLFGAFLMGVPSLGKGASSAEGIALIMAALVSYGFALSLARGLQQQYGGAPVTWRALGMASVFTAPFGLPDVLTAHWSWGPMLSLLALGGLGTGIAFLIMAAAAGRFGASRASGTAFLIPAVALVLGIVVLGERVERISVAGGAICLAGAWFMKRST